MYVVYVASERVLVLPDTSMVLRREEKVMRRASRLFQIVQFMQGRRLTKADQLAEEFGVSVRTIYRDIQALMDSGIPIKGEAGVGYQLPQHFTLPPLTFDHEELEALLLGIEMARSWGGPDVAEAASAVLRKISTVLPETLQPRLTHSVMYVPSFMVPASYKEYLPVMRSAIRERNILAISYQRRDGEESVRKVRPLALYYWGASWCLAAWCDLRGDFRHFRLDRIQSLTVTQEIFLEEDEKSLDTFHRKLQEEIKRSPWKRGDKEENQHAS